jgi:hypothetical protein
LDEANHSVHELEKFGGARGRQQALGFIAFVELTQSGDGRQRRYARDQTVSGLAEVLADGVGKGALEGVVAGSGAASKLGFLVMMRARKARRCQKRPSSSDALDSTSAIVVAIQSRSASRRSSSLAGKCTVTVLGATSARSAMSLIVVSR